MSTTPVAIDLEGPAGRTPPGVVPHLTNSSEDQKWYYVGVVTCLVIAGIFVVLRFYTKLRIIRRTDLSDCKLARIISSVVKHGSNSL